MPDKQLRPFPLSSSTSSNRARADFEIDLPTCFLKMATCTSSITFPYEKHTISSTKYQCFHLPTPSLKASVFDPKQLGFPGWRQNSRSVPSSLVHGGDWLWLRPPSSRHCGKHGMHSSVRPAFHENPTDSGAKPDLQAGSRGSIFSDSSYSVSSSMMRALSSRY